MEVYKSEMTEKKKVKKLVASVFIYELEMEEEYSGDEHVEFMMNESTSCADNRLRDIKNFIEHYPKLSCACTVHQGFVVKNVTLEDLLASDLATRIKLEIK